MQGNPKIKANEIDSLRESLVSRMNQQMVAMRNKVQEQRNAEEQERLRQIQLKMEAEKKAKDEEERKLREEEENRRKKVIRLLAVSTLIDFNSSCIFSG